SLPRLLASKPSALWTVSPSDTALAAMQLMSDKHIGFLIVLEHGNMVGVVSERDFGRRVLLKKKPPETTQVADIMTREVISVDLSEKFADCLRLMHAHGIRSAAKVAERLPWGRIRPRHELATVISEAAVPQTQPELSE